MDLPSKEIHTSEKLVQQFPKNADTEFVTQLLNLQMPEPDWLYDLRERCIDLVVLVDKAVHGKPLTFGHNYW